MKKIWLLMTLLLVFVCASPQLPKAAAFADRPVYFLVYDQSQEMDQSTFSSWRQMVKMVYHFPDYKLATETQAARTQARELLSNYSATDKANLQAIAKKIGADVVVVAVVHEMSEETIMDGFYGWSDPGNIMYVPELAQICMLIMLMGINLASGSSGNMILRIWGCRSIPQTQLNGP